MSWTEGAGLDFSSQATPVGGGASSPARQPEQPKPQKLPDFSAFGDPVEQPPAPSAPSGGGGGGLSSMPSHRKAFLQMIAEPESGMRYNVRYDGSPTGAVFDRFDDHPRQYVSGPHGKTSAAGAYQFTASTWDDLGGGEFTPGMQDRRAWELATQRYRQTTGRDLDRDLQEQGVTPPMLQALQPTWAALGGDPNEHIERFNQKLGHPETGRPFLDAGDGKVATEESITVTNPRLNGGRPTNIPSIWNGERPPFEPNTPEYENWAVDQALKSGQEFQSFDSIDRAVEAAQQRSDRLGRQMRGDPLQALPRTEPDDLMRRVLDSFAQPGPAPDFSQQASPIDYSELMVDSELADQVSRSEVGALGNLRRGFMTGVRGIQQGWHGTMAGLTDDEETRQAHLERYEELAELTEQNMMEMPEFTEIRSVGDAIMWASGQAGALTPIVGSIMAGGAAGGKTGGLAGSVAGPKGATAGAIAGSVVGSFSTGYMLYAGGMYGDLVTDETADVSHEDARNAALIYGAPAAGVSIVVPMGVMASVTGYLGRDFVKGRIRNMVAGAGLGLGAEGVAEGVAEAFVIEGERSVGREISEEDARRRILNAAAAGGLMGFGLGAVGGVGRAQGDIDTIVDSFLDQAEQVYQSGDRAQVAQFAIDSLESAESLTADQQAMLNYLRTERANASAPINAELARTQQISLDVARRDASVNVARAEELAMKRAEGTLTGAEAEELTAIFANSPEARQSLGEQLQSEAQQEAAAPAEPDLPGTQPEGMTLPQDETPEMAPDAPTAEPIEDIEAQLGDLMDVEHPRQGVYLPKSTLDHLDQAGGPDIISDGVAIEDFDGRGGMLIVRDQDMAERIQDARDEILAELDPSLHDEAMQRIIGELTGAGEGKPADGDAVVRQTDETGATTQETLTTAEEAPHVAEDMQETAPERPVDVVPPEQAVTDREQDVAGERDALVTPAPSRSDAPDFSAETDPDISTHRQIGPRGQELGVEVETPAGEIRRSRDPENPWEVTMPVDYGGLVDTVGPDGDPIDVFIGPNPESGRVFVIDQMTEDGAFDEPKVMAGFESIEQAEQTYFDSFEGDFGRQIFGGIQEMSFAELPGWAEEQTAQHSTAEPEAPTAQTEPAARPQRPRGPRRLPESEGDALHSKPVTNVLRQLGGIDPSAPVAGELRHMGIDTRAAPGLYRRGGLQALDNIPVDEHPIFQGRVPPGEYIPEEMFLDALRDEYHGQPWRSLTQQEIEADQATDPQDAAALEEVREFFEEHGLNTADQDLMHRAARYVRMGMDVDSAVERASIELVDETHTPVETIQIEAETDLPGFFDGDQHGTAAPGVPESSPTTRPVGQGEEGSGGPRAPPDRGAEDAPDGQAPQSATEPTEAGDQTVIPGAEQVSDTDLAGIRAGQPLRPRRPQQAMDEGLFGDEAAQTDLVDMTRRPDDELPVEDDRARQRRENIEAMEGVEPDAADTETATDAAEPPIVAYRREAAEIESRLPPVADGQTRLWRGNRPGEVGTATRFTNDLPGIALPFRDGYGGPLSYVDVPTDRLPEFVSTGVAAADAEFTLPSDIAEQAQEVPTSASETAPATEPETAADLSTEPAETTEIDPEIARMQGVEALRDQMLGEGFRDIRAARKFAAENGITDRGKALDETIEQAIVMAARDIIESSRAQGRDDQTILRRLVDLYGKQPRLSERTSTSMVNQAYSTPAPLGFVASRLAGINDQTTVYEPSAGTGMLLIDANRSRVHANELESNRRRILRDQGFLTATQQDATDPATTRYAMSHNLQPAGSPEGAGAQVPFDVVIGNPPFGTVREGGEKRSWNVEGLETDQIDHAIALESLRAMADDGRAVLIVGSVKEGTEETRRKGYRGANKRKFYKTLYDNYQVTDHFTVSGDLYARQGASWPVDVIVIEGRGQSARKLPAAELPELLDSWEALEGKIPDAPREVSEPGGVPERPGDTGEAPVEGGVRRPDGPRGDDTVGRPAPVGERPEPGLLPTSETDSAVDDADVRGEPGVGGEPETGQPGTRPAGPRDVREPDGEPATGRQPVTPERGRGNNREITDKPNAAGQAAYHPLSRSNDMDTLTPVNMASVTRDALDVVEARRGQIDEWVAQELGYDVSQLPDHFAAEQIDAIALALDNVKRGEGFVLGDQTGIGKGRVVAAMIRYALQNEMIPVFVTEKADLFGDMHRDLTDIGMQQYLGAEPRIFMTNNESVPLNDEALEWVQERDEAKARGKKPPKRRGHFLRTISAQRQRKVMSEAAHGAALPDYDMVFTTYSQWQTVRGEEPFRRNFFRQIAPRSFFILDETHNAGGQGEETRQASDAAPTRAQYARELVNKAQAVVYSSATYAKRPQVMDLFARTGMGKAVESAKLLPDLIARGGVPLQQVTAAMLSRAGQYIRRERSFEGINYHIEGVPVSEEGYEKFSTAVRAIYEFDREVSEFREEWAQSALDEMGAGLGVDTGVGDSSASATGFNSIMHNVIGQMILAIKADSVADMAIASHKEGRKPVIGAANTMESFISDFAAHEGIGVGEAIDLDFAAVLQRYLQRTLRITIKHADDTKEHRQIPVDELEPHLRRLYNAASDAIDAGDYTGMPVSPLDWIRHRMSEAGIKVAEITGRQTMMDYGAGDVPFLVERPKRERGSAGKALTKAQFNNGGLDAVILNQSGSTGISLHASSTFKDQKPRRMIIAQADPNIDTHMQMLGRINRTGQVALPDYVQPTAEIPAEVRPTSVLMKKMASLNANTTAARSSALTGDAVDFMNDYGERVAAQVLKEDPDTNARLGNPLKFDEKDRPQLGDILRKATGRIVLLPPAQQQSLLDRLTEGYNQLIEQLDAMGENALEAKTLDLQAETIEATQVKDKTGDSPFEDGVWLERVSVKSQGRAMSLDDAASAAASSMEIKTPDGAGAMQKLRHVQREASSRLDGFVADNVARFQSYVEQHVPGIKDPEARTRTNNSLQQTRKEWEDIARLAYPGAIVNLTTNLGEMPAVVTAVARRGKSKNPLALSSWEVTFAVPTGMRSMIFSMSQLYTASRAREEGDMGADLSAAKMGDRENLEQIFENARNEGRETRYIFTGNMLAAFDQAKGRGQIINYTTADGGTKPGIMTGRGFNVDKFLKDRKVRFTEADQIGRFLAAVPDGVVRSEDGVVQLLRRGGEWVIETPSAKAKAGRYFLDKSVLEAIEPREFRRAGRTMTVELDKGRFLKAVEALQQLDALFGVNTHQEEAEAAVSGQEDGGERLTQRQETPRVDINRIRGLSQQQMNELLEPVARDVMTTIRRVAGDVDVDLQATIPVERDATRVVSGAEMDAALSDPLDTLGGFYDFNRNDPSRAVVAVALLDPNYDPHQVAYHEAWHHVELSLMTPGERRLLNADLDRLRGLAAEGANMAPERADMIPRAEVTAFAFQAYVARRERGAPLTGLHIGIRRAFDRVMAVIQRTRNYLRGHGYTRAEDLFDRVAAGELAGRQRQPVAQAQGEGVFAMRRGRGVRARPISTEQDATRVVDSILSRRLDGRPEWDGRNGELPIENVRIDSVARDAGKLVGFFESASDKLRRSGFPVLVDLANRVDRYYDNREARVGWINGRVRQHLQKIGLRRRQAALRAFGEYWRHHDNGRPEEAEAVLQNAPQGTRELVEEVKSIYSDVGDINQRIVTPLGRGMKVFDPSIGGWRKIGKVEHGKFWPRTLKPEVQRVLANPHHDAELWNDLVDALIDEGHIDLPDQALGYIRNYFSPEVSQDYFAGIEKARGIKLPEVFYDYSWDTFQQYAWKWTNRISQAEQFGQKTTEDSKDMFDRAIEGTLDTRTQNYVNAVANSIYNRRENDVYTWLLQQLNLIATGIQLGNPATAALNLIGGTGLNVKLFGAAPVARAYGQLIKEWSGIQQKGVEFGILGKDVLNILRDAERMSGQYLDDTGKVQNALARFSRTMMTWGGYRGTENIIRATAMIAARIQLQDALKTWNESPSSRKARKYRAFMQRNRIRVNRLIAENGDGAETARYLRLMVNIPQGSYRLDQTPVFVDTPMGRFLFKYQKFTTQVSRMFWQQNLKPFYESAAKGGEELTIEGRQERVRSFMQMFRWFATAFVSGSLILGARSMLFNYNDPGPDWDDLLEALNDDDRMRAWGLIFSRAFHSMMAASALGFFGNYIQFAADVADQQRVKNPLDPPGLASIEAVQELVLRGVEQGKLTARDLDEISERTLALYRGYKRIGLTAIEHSGAELQEAQYQSARRDLVYSRKAARQFAEEYEIPHTRTFTGRFGRTPRSPMLDQVNRALMVGNGEQARMIVRRALDAEPDPQEKKRIMASVRSSIRTRHPVKVGSSTSRQVQSEFLAWAHDNLAPSNAKRIKELAQRYDRAAAQAGF